MMEAFENYPVTGLRPGVFQGGIEPAIAAHVGGVRVKVVVGVMGKENCPGIQALMEAFENYPVTDYTVIQREGMKIAVFGIMGVDSDECAPIHRGQRHPGG